MKILIIQRVVPHYRVHFFTALRTALLANGIEMILLYGKEYPGTVPKSMELSESWAIKIKNFYVKVSKHELVWQPVLPDIKRFDIIVVEDADRLVVNILLLAMKKVFSYKFVYWGHGKSLAVVKSSPLHRMLRKWRLKADHYLAYTVNSSKSVIGAGFLKEKVTIVENTTDTEKFKRVLSAVNRSHINKFRDQYGITGANVVIFSGGMSPIKDIDFLVSACKLLRSGDKQFEIVFVGDGPELPKIKNFCSRYHWAHTTGALFGRPLATVFRASKLLLMPGAVGLVVIDSFVAKTPLFTVRDRNHGPEIAYVTHQENGIIAPYDLDAYCAVVSTYLQSENMLGRLKQGCEKSMRKYTIQKMVDNFVQGTEMVLGKTP